jgi:hypothetical protein
MGVRGAHKVLLYRLRRPMIAFGGNSPGSLDSIIAQVDYPDIQGNPVSFFHWFLALDHDIAA